MRMMKYFMRRPKRPPERARAPKIYSRLITLEREITAMLSIKNRRQATPKKASAPVGPFKTHPKAQGLAATGPTPTPLAASPVLRVHEPKVANHGKQTAKNEAIGRASAIGFSLSICFGLLVMCGVIIVLLFLQLRDLKVEMAVFRQRLAATEANVGKFEKIAQQKTADESRISDAAPRRIPIKLSNDDVKVVRSSIKVLPPKPGVQQKIHVGDAILNAGSAPVPESLVNQLPKLRGAKFLVDQNSAIVIIGEGSNRADAVIEPQ
jgi:hypothetical protein